MAAAAPAAAPARPHKRPRIPDGVTWLFDRASETVLSDHPSDKTSSAHVVQRLASRLLAPVVLHWLGDELLDAVSGLALNDTAAWPQSACSPYHVHLLRHATTMDQYGLVLAHGAHHISHVDRDHERTLEANGLWAVLWGAALCRSVVRGKASQSRSVLISTLQARIAVIHGASRITECARHSALPLFLPDTPCGSYAEPDRAGLLMQLQHVLRGGCVSSESCVEGKTCLDTRTLIEHALQCTGDQCTDLDTCAVVRAYYRHVKLAGTHCSCDVCTSYDDRVMGRARVPATTPALRRPSSVEVATTLEYFRAVDQACPDVMALLLEAVRANPWTTVRMLTPELEAGCPVFAVCPKTRTLLAYSNEHHSIVPTGIPVGPGSRALVNPSLMPSDMRAFWHLFNQACDETLVAINGKFITYSQLQAYVDPLRQPVHAWSLCP